MVVDVCAVLDGVRGDFAGHRDGLALDVADGVRLEPHRAAFPACDGICHALSPPYA